MFKTLPSWQNALRLTAYLPLPSRQRHQTLGSKEGVVKGEVICATLC